MKNDAKSRGRQPAPQTPSGVGNGITPAEAHEALATACLVSVPVGFALTIQSDFDRGFWIWLSFVVAAGLILRSNESPLSTLLFSWNNFLPAMSMNATIVFKILLNTILDYDNKYNGFTLRPSPYTSLPAGFQTISALIFLSLFVVILGIVTALSISISRRSANKLVAGLRATIKYPVGNIEHATKVVRALAALVSASVAIWAIFF